MANHPQHHAGFFFALVGLLLFSNFCTAQVTGDSLHVIVPADSLHDRTIINHDAKVYLRDKQVVVGIALYMKEGKIMMGTGKEIPVAQITKIRLYRHIYGKTVTVVAIPGFLAGFLYFYASANSHDSAIAGGVLGAIPCAAAGAVIGVFVMPFFKYRFAIDGREENVLKMVKRVGSGRGKDW